MNGQSPPHRIATPLVASSAESPAVHPPVWHRGPDLLTLGSTGAAILGFCFVVLGLLPGLVLTLLLLLGFEAIPAEPSSDGSSLTTSLFIQLLCGSVVLMGLVFAWIFSASRVLPSRSTKTSNCLLSRSPVALASPPKCKCHLATSFVSALTCSPVMTAMAILVSCARDRGARSSYIDWPRALLWRRWSFMLRGCGE